MTCSAPSIPEDSPAAVTIFPLSTKRLSETTRVFGAAALSSSIRPAKVVASRPSSSPAFARKNAPLQTEKTSSAPFAFSRTQRMTAAFSSCGGTLPPGSTIRSGFGALAEP